VVDTTGLSTVKHLDLAHCRNIHDCSHLAGDVMQSLCLQDCLRLVDVAALGLGGSLSFLDLTRTAVDDVSALGGIHTVKLSGMSNATPREQGMLSEHTASLPERTILESRAQDVV